MAAIVGNGKVSLFSFLFGASIILLPVIASLVPTLGHVFHWLWWLVITVHAVGVIAVLKSRYDDVEYQVAIRGGILGLVFGWALLGSFTSKSNWCYFAWYMTALSFFHWSEYFTTSVTNPKNLCLDSYLLDHSREYHIAAIASWIEFTIEIFFFPGMKGMHWLNMIGLLMVISGEILRKVAMFTASTNFNHYVQRIKDDEHQLVTHGIYSLCRHPSYVGWFYWSVGTQVLLFNPLCLVGYTWASLKFFSARIEDEEFMLLQFFGKSYSDYQKAVGTGLPGIKGYKAGL